MFNLFPPNAWTGTTSRTIFKQHYGIFKAKWAKNMDKQYEIHISAVILPLDVEICRIRTIKEINHPLMEKLSEMSGVSSSKFGNRFLQGHWEEILWAFMGKWPPQWQTKGAESRILQKGLLQSGNDMIQECWIILSDFVLDTCICRGYENRFCLSDSLWLLADYTSAEKRCIQMTKAG